ncbi:hypothetical protein [Pontibaca salina]|uniref:Uncharacterized protein n=1 Tax=Pontibaca salina TaxID=2795731 RepID=A0A934HSS9_9RHOB|nr:hypothetical protein [Pontibaca salina]MBI6630201.1 hypothetical protein [Pontibaca salina]
MIVRSYPLILLLLALVFAGIAIWAMSRQRTPDAAKVAAAYATPLAAPEGPLRVFHLGHSLVGRDMPAMLAQFAGKGHDYASQLGWGTSLREHWEPDIEINGFEAENAHPHFRAAHEAIASGNYDAVVLTEMVELRDAIRYHDSARYLSRWADLARTANPDVRIYLYETWHSLTDPDWLERLDDDLAQLWERRVLLPDLIDPANKNPVRVIPAGQVLARFVRKVETAGGIDNVTDRTALFARDPSGELDPIHMGDLGNYLVALTHFATFYHRSPVGLSRQLRRADGSTADAPGPEAARVMQETVWEVVGSYRKTGVAQ